MAAHYFQLAADQGPMEAQYQTGFNYFNEQGVVKNKAEAMRYFKLAADQGYAKASYNLGIMYFVDRRVAKNLKKAIKYLRQVSSRRGLKLKYISRAEAMLQVCKLEQKELSAAGGVDATPAGVTDTDTAVINRAAGADVAAAIASPLCTTRLFSEEKQKDKTDTAQSEEKTGAAAARITTAP